jgi:hypothetical protein
MILRNRTLILFLLTLSMGIGIILLSSQPKLLFAEVIETKVQTRLRIVIEPRMEVVSPESEEALNDEFTVKDGKATKSLCIAVNEKGGGFTVTALGTGRGQSFEAKKSEGAVPLSVYFNNTVTGSRSRLTPGRAIEQRVSRKYNYANNCGPKGNAQIQVDAGNAANSSAKGMLTVIIEPSINI